MIAIGLGGNVGGEDAVRERFVRAREALAQLGEARSAALYRSAPIGPAQPAFLNTALRIRADDGVLPGELVATLHEIERLLGRDRANEVRWGPRPIDLDVLLWDARVIRSPELEVPHPRLIERRFALEPLIDLFGEAHDVPGAGTLGALRERVRDQVVELIDERW
ncbi:MAG TPA: 2-amino-4-hydroxy-6-hydroxymethyldihydropteridine diphosphokinase [Kofleriaceae bacterium]|jgi:2-amino-4-hydroxy-6-hydroxymethyldihydropteridine diphosphokinase|nr:2-amino-4-hydroxy-6-hydroxymethyldihydropteridine diphosphokinase [Polyangiales bacterium]